MKFKIAPLLCITFVSCSCMHTPCHKELAECEEKIRAYEKNYKNVLATINQQAPHNTFWKTQAQKEYEKLSQAAQRSYLSCVASKFHAQ